MMAKAARVRGIKPSRSLQENARKVIQARLDEFLSWQRALVDPSLVADLHNMRIAAKRLRYAIEMFEICIDKPKSLLKELTSIQEVLGDIHDLDVLIDVLRGHLHDIDERRELDMVEIMAVDGLERLERVQGLRRLLAASARDPRRVGYASLLAEALYRRRQRYSHFQSRYSAERLEEFGADVRGALELRVKEADARAVETALQRPPVPTEPQ